MENYVDNCGKSEGGLCSLLIHRQILLNAVFVSSCARTPQLLNLGKSTIDTHKYQQNNTKLFALKM